MLFADARDFRICVAAAGARGCGSGRRVAPVKRRSSQGSVVGRLRVPCWYRSAGEHVSAGGGMNAQIMGKNERVVLLYRKCGAP